MIYYMDMILRMLLFFLCYASLDASERYVLTGGPGVGKSSVIDLLQKMGYQTVPEAFTLLLNSGRIDVSTLGTLAFRRELMDLHLSLEQNIDDSRDAFLDRCTIDVLAFGLFRNLAMPQELLDVPNQQKYDLVFILDPLPEEQYQRSDAFSYEESNRIHQCIITLYEERGYRLIQIPYSTPEERANLILHHISSEGTT